MRHGALLTALGLVATGCGGASAGAGSGAFASTPAAPSSEPSSFEEAVLALPPCDPSPWIDGEVPRLTAPFEGGGSDEAAAAGITVLPRIRNQEELTHALGREFVRIMVALDGVPAGTARFWLLVDARGEVAALEVAERTDYALLDAAGSRVALMAKMTPAVRSGCTVPVWVTYPVTFQRGRLRGGGGG